MKTIKISFLIQGLDGGIASLICGFVPELIKYGFQAQCLFIGTRTDHPAIADLCNMKDIVVRLYESSNSKASKAAHAFLVGSSLQSELRAFTPDLIICAGILPAIIYGLFTKADERVPVVLWEHGPQNSYTYIKKMALRLCSHTFTKVISPSRSSLRVFLEQFPFFSSDACFVIENGTPPSAFIHSSATLGLTQALRIVMPARMDGIQKDQESLIEACSLLVSEGKNISLTLVGNGPAKSRLAALVQARNLNGVVTIRDHTKQVAAELRQHNVLCLSSRWEGFGLVLVEGMFAGMLVMASNVTGTQDVIENGATGILFEPNSPRAIAIALKQVLADPAVHECIAQAGHKVAIKRWTIQQMAERASILFRQWGYESCCKAA